MTYTAKTSTPSVSMLTQKLRLSKEQAQKVKEILTGKSDLMAWASARQYYYSCYHPPTRHEMALYALNEAMGGYGAEYVPSVLDTSYESYGVEYINLGETYQATLCYDRNKGKWMIAAWGDIVESDPQRFEF